MSKVGNTIEADNGRWSFGGDVAEKFDDHIRQSVPFYDEGHDLVAKISDFFLSEATRGYELGCSTGELLARVAARNQNRGTELIGIDSEPAMTAIASKKCAPFTNVRILQGDIIETDLEPADLIISYYTMQFVRPRFRQQVFDKIFQSLNWGGGFLLFEKVRAPDARFQDMMTSVYTDFKLDHGLNEAEIINKTKSLKGILEPFSTQGNLDLLTRAGFIDVMTVYKYVCFEGFLAIK